jgi:hypothetical protein
MVAALAFGAGVASGTRGPTNAAAARTAAQRVLAQLTLPPGATRSQVDPSGSALANPGFSVATPDLVDLHKFWRVPGDPETVYNWITAHPPPGSKLTVHGGGGTNGVMQVWVAGFSFLPPSMRGAPSEMLVVELTQAHGGGTALRADGQVVWLFERPASERIPNGVRAVMISEHRISGTSPGPWTVSDRARVGRIVALVNRLPAGQPGTYSCPGDSGPSVTITFGTAGSGGKRLATAYADGGGCGFVSLWIRGHRRPFLDGGPGLIRRLGSLLGTSFS